MLLRWHDLWDLILGADPVPGALNTSWQWILAIVFLVVTIRIVLFPLFVKQIKSQRAMQRLQPKMKELQQRYKGDRETLQKEMMELYRTEKANPLMGCLPMLLQAPVFIALLWVLRRIDPDKYSNYAKTLYTWTEAQWDSAINAKLFGAPIWATFLTTQKDLKCSEHYDSCTTAATLNVQLVSGILIALMIVTTYLTTRQMILKTGWNADPQQRMIQKLMLYGIPVMLLFSGGIFPIGVVLYWVVNNAFSLGQQIWVLRKYPPPKTDTSPKADIKAKPGSKKYEEQLREKRDRAKAMAPKVGAKPKDPKKATSNAAEELKRKQEQAKAKAAQGPRPGAKPTKRKKGGATRGANK
nr:membrane protein insertase YidC [Stackebrandtia nassauensis]